MNLSIDDTAALGIGGAFLLCLLGFIVLGLINEQDKVNACAYQCAPFRAFVEDGVCLCLVTPTMARESLRN